LLLFFGSTILAQDIKIDSVRNQRMTVSSGGWLSGGINTSLISVGQNGASPLLIVTDGQTEFKGNFGFVLPLIEKIEPNQAPIAVTAKNSIFYQLGSDLQLNGFDPDGDLIEFVVVQQPKSGELTTSGLGSSNFKFTPDRLLTPQNGYRDTLKFKVVEAEGEKLESDIAILPFTFNIVDEGHEISGLSITSSSEASKSFKLALTDPKLNNSYGVSMSYIDLSDPINPQSVEIVNESFPLSSFTIEESSLFTNIGVSIEDHPYIFSSEKVFLILNVTTPTGFSDDDAFILTNDLSGGSTGTISIAAPNTFTTANQQSAFENNTSTDGLFFNFASERQTPENTAVALNLFAAELGDFDLTKSTIAISKAPNKGTITDPILVKSTANLSQWTLFYIPEGEVGYLDSLQFSVTSTERNLTVSAYAKVEVVGVNDPPSLSTVANQLINEEETTTVDLNFSDLDNELSLTVTSSDPTNVPVSVSGNQITIVPAENYNGSASITVLVEETGTDELYSKFETFEVEVTPVNDRPIMASIENQTISEDNAFTYTLAATDVDARVPLFTYAITPDIPGVVDIATNGNSLTVTPIANYNGTINFSVTADDRLGTNTSQSVAETFSLVINPVNDAPITTATIPNQSVIDIQPAYVMDLGQYFQDVETADTDLIITENSTSGLFTFGIENDNLTVTPIQGQNGSEDVTFTVSDGEFSVTQTITFSIQANSTDIVASTIDDLTLAEDFASSTIDLSNVFTASSDANAVFSYTAGGLSNLTAEVTNNSLIITSPKDYSGSESVFLIASTNGKSSFTTFKIIVSPVNDAPTLGSVSAQNIQEDGAISNLFMSYTDIDTDLNGLTFSAASSNAAIIATSDISLTKNQGGVLISANAVANASGQTTIAVTINDGEFNTTQNIDVTVASINDVPTVASTSVANATEDNDYIQSITGLFTDIDGDQLSYTLENNPSWLSIANNNIVGKPVNDDVGNVQFFITANDGNGGSVRQSFSFAVANTNDAPTVGTPVSDITVSEDVLLSALISDNAFNDVDGDNLSLTATFTGAEWLSFNTATNRFTGTPTNSDVGTVDIVITATDPSGAAITDNVVLTVVNTNDAPTALTISSTTIDENSALGTTLGSLSTTDVDANETFTYSLVEGDGARNNELFTISGDQLVTNSTIDFEVIQSLSVRIQTTDAAGASISQAFSVSVNNVNEAPTDISSSSLTIAENSGALAEVGSLSTVDPDAGDTFTLSFVTGTGSDDNSSFEISSGKLLAKSDFDFETKSSFSVRIKTEDAGGLSFEEVLAISVSNVNEAPTDILINTNAIDENQAIGTLIGTLSSIDQDNGDTFTYSLKVDIEDNNSFGVDSDGLITAADIDFETKSVFTVTVTSTDAVGATFDKTLSINVNNVAEPSIASIDGLVFDIIDIAETANQSFTVANTGDTDIEVTEIALPEGYSASMSSFIVAIGSSTDVEVTFTPSEAKVYAGEIVMQSTAGETRINISGEATIVTANDDDIIDSDEVKLFPNPAQKYVTIDLSEIPQTRPNLMIINLSGKSVWEMKNVSVPKVTVDVSNYPTGTYLIKVSSNMGTVIKKLLILK
ncbi:MAG: hypothetical protein ACI82Q_000228, partial [Nonlabens sp.]